MIKTNNWRLIESGAGRAGWNMAVDEALLMEYREGDFPILRLYRWENSVSLGRFSKIHGCLDLEKLHRHGLPYVRRLSGGGVLVHGGDISYSLIMPRHPEKGVKESYRFLCSFLIRFYRKLGYDADFACDCGHRIEKSDICLAGIEGYDILIDGTKMGGNAQRHIRNVLFQHGSIPMRLESAMWSPIFLTESGMEDAATLEKLGNTLSDGELVSLLKETFCETFGVSFRDEGLTLSEEERAKKLMREKYTQERWNIDAKSV